VDEKPCCEAEALRRIRQVDVGGMVVGINMIDHVLSEVKALSLCGDKEIGDALLKKVKIYNYVPPSAEENYRIALLREYRKNTGG
jgi:hypothetical protein